MRSYSLRLHIYLQERWPRGQKLNWWDWETEGIVWVYRKANAKHRIWESESTACWGIQTESLTSSGACYAEICSRWLTEISHESWAALRFWRRACNPGVRVRERRQRVLSWGDQRVGVWRAWRGSEELTSGTIIRKQFDSVCFADMYYLSEKCTGWCVYNAVWLYCHTVSLSLF